MWTCTNFGFFSATERKLSDIPEGDNRTLQIRARRRDHLDALRELMGDALGPLLEIPNRDYEFRSYCTPEAWGRALYDMSLNIDYHNFKDSVVDNDLHNAYMSVWTAMYQGLSRKYKQVSAWSSYPSTHNVRHPGSYESVFGKVEKSSPYDGIPDFSDVESDKDDLDDKIEELMEAYAPAVPEGLPGTLTAKDVREWLSTSNRLLRNFFSSNPRWRSFKSSQGRYAIPKNLIGELEEQFNIWHVEKMENDAIQ